MTVVEFESWLKWYRGTGYVTDPCYFQSKNHYWSDVDEKEKQKIRATADYTDFSYEAGSNSS